MIERDTLAGVALLAALAAAALWLDHRVVPPQEHAPGARHRPDSYMEGFVMTHTHPDGTLRNRLRGARMVHYPDDDSTELEQPHMHIYRDREPPWEVVSERGWVSSGAELVLLLGEVRLWREAGLGKGALRVDTTDLRVRPEEDYADSDHPTVIRSDTVRLTGVGMRAYLKEGRLQLLNDVHGRYDNQDS